MHKDKLKRLTRFVMEKSGARVGLFIIVCVGMVGLFAEMVRGWLSETTKPMSKEKWHRS